MLKSLLQRTAQQGVLGVCASAPIALTLLAGCGGSGAISLAKLATNQDAYFGKQVATSGLVEEQGSGNSHYFVLADRQQDLVALEPERLVRRYRGEQVSVRGLFRFEPQVGRLIQVKQISALR
jgi:hypothetical protein